MAVTGLSLTPVGCGDPTDEPSNQCHESLSSDIIQTQPYLLMNFLVISKRPSLLESPR